MVAASTSRQPARPGRPRRAWPRSCSLRRRSVRATSSEAAAWRTGASSSGHHEEGAAHGQQAQEAALLVQGVVDGLQRRLAHACPGGEVHAGRVGGVQADHAAGGLDHVVRAVGRREMVANGDAGPALGGVDASHRGSI